MDILVIIIIKKAPLEHKAILRTFDSTVTQNHGTFVVFRSTETQWPNLTNPSIRKDYVKQNGTKTVNIQHNLTIKRCKWQIADPTKKPNSQYNKLSRFEREQ